jgi:hypothetical protein
MSVTSNAAQLMNVQFRHHRFSLEAYDEMVSHGILTSDDRMVQADVGIVPAALPELSVNLSDVFGAG